MNAPFASRAARMLTFGQLEAVRYIASGHSQAEAGAAMGISEACVGESLGRARRRLGARSTAHLVALAIALGLLTDPVPILAAAALAKRAEPRR